MLDRCSVQWRKIQKLEGKTNRSADGECTLTDLKSTFTPTMDADYQMSKFQIGVFHLLDITFKSSVVIFWGLLTMPLTRLLSIYLMKGYHPKIQITQFRIRLIFYCKFHPG